jgi:hypothetical protein
MPYATLSAIPHLMRRSFLGNLFVSQMPMVGKLWTGQILENSLLFLRRLFNALVEFILSRVLDFLFSPFNCLRMPWTVHTLFCSGLTGSWKL